MYAISINQSHGFMCDNPEIKLYKRSEITDIDVIVNAFTQIGFRTHCATCRNISIKPSGLTFPIYITKDGNYEDVLEKLNTITRDDVDRVEVTLLLPELGDDAYQIISIWKMKE